MKNLAQKMMMILAVLTVIFVTSCKKDNAVTPALNHDPSEVIILKGDVLTNQIQLHWLPATDPDGDQLVYDVYVMDAPHKPKHIVGENVHATSWAYSATAAPDMVIIAAKDGKGGESTATEKFQ